MMFSFDETITIYNYWRNPANPNDDRLIPHVLHDASWHGGQKVAVDASGLHAADHYTVRILEDNMPEGYVPPDEYKTLMNPTGKWTVQNKDVIVKGAVTFDAQTAAQVTREFTDSFIVMGVSDNRKGFLSHIKIEGA